MTIVAALLAAGMAIDRRDAMERCAEAVIAARHPNMGMLDVSGTTFSWLSVAPTRDGWEIVGSFGEPEHGRRIARRFTCRVGERTTVTFGKVARSR